MAKRAETGGLTQFRNGHVQSVDEGFGSIKFVVMPHGTGCIHNDLEIVHFGLHFVQVELGRAECTKIHRLLGSATEQK